MVTLVDHQSHICTWQRECLTKNSQRDIRLPVLQKVGIECGLSDDFHWLTADSHAEIPRYVRGGKNVMILICSSHDRSTF